uniref:NADH-ubiquinone oxidoreductase chain 2 n=1 Tax=Andrena chekiangensis TaxID=2572772 RepID=A0A4D6SVT5_9HYME|nr:NADH dehydrogenase subunit 2 [Andrena chekiangensis]QCG69810.1 NADH dehydrogenase subunit 2 [Andrena chekiangensis]
MKFSNKMNIQMYIIIIMVLMSTTTNNKVFMWMLIEVATFSFISMMIMSKNLSSSILYFIISFISSTVMFIGLITYPSMNLSILIIIGVMIKVAMFPFNYWFNLISKSVNFMNLSILMTLMKFVPMNMMHMMTEMNQFTLMMIIASMILSPIMSLNKFSVKLILSYSSIHQTSLMMMIMFMNFYMFIMYFTMYSLVTITLLSILNNEKNMLKYEFNMNKKTKMIYFIMMISYSYFPPMSTFIMKWSIVENMMMMNSMFMLISIIVMISSFIMIWSYLNFMNNNIYTQTNFNKMFMIKKTPNMKNPLIMIHMMTLMSFIYIYINF